MDTQEALLYARRCARRTFNQDAHSDAEEFVSIGAMAVLNLYEKDPHADEGLVWTVCQRAMIDEWRKAHGRKGSPRRQVAAELEDWHAVTEDVEVEESFEDATRRIREAYQVLDGLPSLTLRHRQILQLLADGGTRPTIAADLGVSVDTIKSHSLVLYRKLGVRTAAAAVAKGIALGVVTPPKL